MNYATSQPARKRNAVLAALETFRDQGCPRGLLALVLFLYVCENEGLTISELALVGRIDVSSAARLVKRLSSAADDAPAEDGVVLFELSTESDDKRLKFVHLSADGRKLRDRIEDLIAGAAPIRGEALDALTTLAAPS